MGTHSHSRFEMDPKPERLGRYEAVRKHYDGWIDIKQSMADQIDRYATENFLVFKGGWITVQQFKYSKPVKSIWSTGHDCYVFDLALGSRAKGSTMSVVRPGEPEAKPSDMGRVFMVPPDQTTSCGGPAGHGRNMRCFLDAEMIDSYLSGKPDWNEGHLARWDSFTICGGEIEWFLRRMYRELQDPDFATTDMIEMLAKQLAVEVIRAFDLRRADERYHVGGLAPWRMRLIRERVKVDGPAPSLGELASLCDMTVRHLGRAFRIETGKTIGKFVEACVVERANEKLLAGMPVGEVAAGLGYATSGSFASAFRRATGLLPSEVRGLGRRN
jgi:AraC-like DNA-binding protein